MIQTVVYTSLFPNRRQPHHGVFVEQRLRHLLATGEVESKVVAPVPWFPKAAASLGGRYASFSDVPAEERRNGLEILHPRYPVVPKVGWTLVPFGMAAATWRSVKRIRDRWQGAGLIDAHYFFPDGVAAALIGQMLDLPVVITARGTDINLIPRYRFPRWLIQRAARRSAGMITVCNALKEAMVEMGIPEERIRVLRNGVDLARFRPLDHEEARRELSLEGTVILSVGHLIERKGHHLVIEALPDLPDATLLVVGEGPEREYLERLTVTLGVKERVRFIGAVRQDELALYYSAADALVLASSREGMANVLLESIACGTPVVASPVWGTPEVVAAPEAGELASELSPKALAEAVHRLMARRPSRDATRRYAEGFSWDSTTQGQLQLFREILGGAG